jgi:hypothetical protein
MKKLLLALLLTVSVRAQTESTAIAVMAAGGNVPTNIFAGRAALNEISLYGATNTVVCYFYDTTGTATNIVLPAFTNTVSYTTNWVTSLTNYLGHVYSITNSGTFSGMVLSGSTTNERPRITVLSVPAASTRTRAMNGRILANGLSFNASGYVIVEAIYTPRP